MKMKGQKILQQKSKSCVWIPISLIVLIAFLLFVVTIQPRPLPLTVKNISHTLTICTDSPLDINGNVELAAAANGGGNGQPTTPYILKDYIINANGLDKPGISIQNTNAFFILQNCTVTNTDERYAGIYLNNVTHARLENNKAHYSQYGGFKLENCHNNTLIGNIIHDLEFGGGIELESCINTLLINNTVYSTQSGIYLGYSNETRLIGNTAYDNGVAIESFLCYGVILTGNTANNNHGNGIFLYGGYKINNTLNNNNANDNGGHGIFISNCNGVLLIGNIANDNRADGMHLAWNIFLRLVNNTCNGNAATGIYVGYSSPTLINNTANNNEFGINILSLGAGAISTGNTANYNTIHGFQLQIQVGEVTGNTAIGNGAAGIHLDSSSNNIICNNILLGNFACIVEGDHCSANRIENNTCQSRINPGLVLAIIIIGFTVLHIYALAIKRKRSFS